MECRIKEITNENLEEFKKVYGVFSEAPYFESYTDEELEEIFTEYLENGNIYGAYNENECVGIVALERGRKNEHPVTFKTENVMYLADIAVLSQYRNKRIGSQLMLYGVMQSKILGSDVMYMRTLKKGSMSIEMAKRLGFKTVLGAEQLVERERTDGSRTIMENIFLEIDLKNLDKDKLKQEIENYKLIKEKEENIK